MSGLGLLTLKSTRRANLNPVLFCIILLTNMKRIQNRFQGNQKRFGTLENLPFQGLEAMQKYTLFDSSEHHIYVVCNLQDWYGAVHTFRAIIDTGAPTTEFSDEFLASIGLIKIDNAEKVGVHSLEQTKKYGKLTLSQINCLGQSMENITVRVSKFADGWGVDALIGLDFFRQFRVTIDYKAGQIITEPFVS